MELFTVYDAGEPTSDKILVKETHVGKGIFAVRNYPAHAVIGQITGNVFEDPNYGTAYSFEIDEVKQLEPEAPFRYVNHSCDPNCEFERFDQSIDGLPGQRLYLIALEDIEAGEELTIDYHWPADAAIRCECHSENCRGWVVCLSEIDKIDDSETFQQELESEQQNQNELAAEIGELDLETPEEARRVSEGSCCEVDAWKTRNTE